MDKIDEEYERLKQEVEDLENRKKKIEEIQKLKKKKAELLREVNPSTLNRVVDAIGSLGERI